MGTLKRDSERRLRIRKERQTGERETLLFCPACDGNRQVPVPVEGAPGRYRSKQCIWCSGEGVVDRTIHTLYARWLSIRNINRLMNRCGPVDTGPEKPHL